MIFCECFADEALLYSLGIAKNNIIHAKSIGEVVKKARKNINSIGLIDEDPGKTKPRCLNDYCICSNQHNVILQTNFNNSKIIALSPRLEEWIIEVCNVVNIDISESSIFMLSTNPDRLHTKLNTRKLPQGYLNLLEKLYTLNNPALLYLKNIIFL
jgi:hypothetical protein